MTETLYKSRKASPAPGIARLAAQLRGNQNKVKVLGYARPSDKDGPGKSLERANTIRDQLLQNGVAPEQVEVVATGQLANGDGVRWGYRELGSIGCAVSLSASPARKRHSSV